MRANIGRQFSQELGSDSVYFKLLGVNLFDGAVGKLIAVFIVRHAQSWQARKPSFAQKLLVLNSSLTMGVQYPGEMPTAVEYLLLGWRITHGKFWPPA